LNKLTLEIVSVLSAEDGTNPWDQINAQSREELALDPIFCFNRHMKCP